MAALSSRANTKVGKVVVISGLMLENEAECCVFVSARCVSRKSAPQLLRLTIWSASPLAENDVTRQQAAALCVQFDFSLHMWESFHLKVVYFRCFFYSENPKCVISPPSNTTAKKKILQINIRLLKQISTL